jgi:hypothetical protein
MWMLAPLQVVVRVLELRGLRPRGFKLAGLKWRGHLCKNHYQ